MQTDAYAEISIPGADPAGDGSSVTGVFAFEDEVVVNLQTRIQPVTELSGVTSEVADMIIDYIGSGSSGDGEGARGTMSIDWGSGVHAVEIDFSSFSGSQLRWGDSGSGGTMGDATGEDREAQMCVLDRYLNTTTFDSGQAATLEVAEYSESGRYGPLNVAPENPNLTLTSDTSSVWEASMTWIETIDVVNSLDGSKQEEF
jgi:hypothetical protein